MTDEADAQFERDMPKVYKYSRNIWHILITFLVTSVIWAIANSRSETKEIHQVCLEVCCQGQVAKFSDTECECKETK